MYHYEKPFYDCSLLGTKERGFPSLPPLFHYFIHLALILMPVTSHYLNSCNRLNKIYCITTELSHKIFPKNKGINL